MGVFSQTFVAMLPLMAGGSSLACQLAPVLGGDVSAWSKNRSTGGFPFISIFAIAHNNLCNATYGIITENQSLACVGLIGMALAAYYSARFVRVGTVKERAEVWWFVRVFCAILFALFALWRVLLADVVRLRSAFGYINQMTIFLSSASPLVKVREVIQNEDSTPLPLTVCLANSVNMLMWSLEGWRLQDSNIFNPCSAGLLVCAAQLALIVRYPSGGGGGGGVRTPAKGSVNGGKSPPPIVATPPI